MHEQSMCFNHCHTNTFTPKPVSMLDLVWVAIGIKLVVQCLAYGPFRKYTQSTAYRTTANKYIIELQRQQSNTDLVENILVLVLEYKFSEMFHNTCQQQQYLYATVLAITFNLKLTRCCKYIYYRNKTCIQQFLSILQQVTKFTQGKVTKIKEGYDRKKEC